MVVKSSDAGADVVTTGNHVWDQREALVFADRHDAFLRPANYPAGTPGRGSGLFVARNGARVLVANLMGRAFMHPDLDDPFRAASEIVGASPLGEQAGLIGAAWRTAPSPKYSRLIFTGGKISGIDALASRWCSCRRVGTPTRR